MTVACHGIRSKQRNSVVVGSSPRSAYQARIGMKNRRSTVHSLITGRLPWHFFLEVPDGLPDQGIALRSPSLSRTTTTAMAVVSDEASRNASSQAFIPAEVSQARGTAEWPCRGFFCLREADETQGNGGDPGPGVRVINSLTGHGCAMMPSEQQVPIMKRFAILFRPKRSILQRPGASNIATAENRHRVGGTHLPSNKCCHWSGSSRLHN